MPFQVGGVAGIEGEVAVNHHQADARHHNWRPPPVGKTAVADFVVEELLAAGDGRQGRWHWQRGKMPIPAPRQPGLAPALQGGPW